MKNQKAHSFWKINLIFLVLFLFALIFVWFLYPQHDHEHTTLPIESLHSNESTQAIYELQAIQPIPLQMVLDPDKVALGERLFHDTKLSGDNTISCAHCHDLERGGTDQLALSKGINNALGSVNTPTVFNTIFNFKQFWDGRAENLTEQIDGPVLNPDEMGSTWPDIVEKLKPEYAQDFKALYSEGLSEETIKDAIATFERSLYTPNARFDQFLRGEETQLSALEKQGYQAFLEFGCIVCHQGIGIGGNMFQRMGAKDDYFKARGQETQADLGRYNVTGEEFDRYRFKVPSLRNVALTFPYFHDGSATNLEEAVSTMARFQLARALNDKEIQTMVAFLKTLTGEYKGKLLQ